MFRLTYILLRGLRGAAERDQRGFITEATLRDYLSHSVTGWCR
jgi:hypothetical protein